MSTVMTIMRGSPVPTWSTEGSRGTGSSPPISVVRPRWSGPLQPAVGIEEQILVPTRLPRSPLPPPSMWIACAIAVEVLFRMRQATALCLRHLSERGGNARQVAEVGVDTLGEERTAR